MRSGRKPKSFHAELVTNLPSLAAWLALACTFGGYVYATCLSEILGLKQGIIFGYSDYISFGFSPRSIVAGVFFVSGTYFYGSYVNKSVDGSVTSVVKSVFYILASGIVIYALAIPYMWLRGVGSFSLVFSETYLAFLIIISIFVLFNLLRLFLVGPGLLGSGYMFLVGMALLSAAFAVLDCYRVWQPVGAYSETPIYDSEIVDPAWVYVITTEKFTVFYDFKADQSVAIKSEDIHKIRFKLTQSKGRL